MWDVKLDFWERVKIKLLTILPGKTDAKYKLRNLSKSQNFCKQNFKVKNVRCKCEWNSEEENYNL